MGIGKTVVQLEYGSNPESLLKEIDSLMKRGRKPDLIYVKLSSSWFPRRELDMPDRLNKLFHANPSVKPCWDDFPEIDLGKYDVQRGIGQDGQVTGTPTDPCVTVSIITHNRTNVACATIDNLVKNLKYSNLKWCISDDLSDEGHIDKLLAIFRDNGVRDVKVCTTNPYSRGLGAALNNALMYSWTNGDLAFTVEDDWILQRPMDLKKYVDVLVSDKDTSMIRLAYLDKRHRLIPYNDYLNVVGKSLFNFIFNNQCGLRHKRIYDAIGYNKENCNGDKQEEDLRDRYNLVSNYGEHFKVLFPKELAVHTFDDPSLYFIHVGKSTNGHVWYEIPKRYSWIYEESWLRKVNGRDPYPIVLITDKEYILNVKKMLKQIRRFSKTKVYVICWDDQTKEKMKDFSFDNVESIVASEKMRQRCIDAAGDMSTRKGYFVPPVGLLKFEICNLVEESHALYMDCDIIINQSFSELLYAELGDFYCGVVKDPYRIKTDVRKYPVMDRIPEYFNSGVLLMNLQLIRRMKVSDQLFETKRNLEHRQLMDQDTFNIVFQGHVKFMDNKYNSLIPIIDDLLNGRKEITLRQINDFYNKRYNKYTDIPNEAVFTHYAGGWAKPWNDKKLKGVWSKL